jgi:galactokinase
MMDLDVKQLNEIFTDIYGNDKNDIERQYRRYEKLIREFQDQFEGRELHLFSTPGRTELGGNHTDHNNGRVLAAAVNLDAIAVAAVSVSDQIIIHSDQYPEPFIIKPKNLDVVEDEKGTTAALIRGIAARFKQLGWSIAGFNACVASDVLPGSGLSSSASIEVLIGTISNHLFNEGRISPEEVAAAGKYAENEYFGKPCGLMDQLTASVGGTIAIDFKIPEKPDVRRVDLDLRAYGYSLLIVDTGSHHGDLTEDYAAVQTEMKSVADAFGKNVCRDIDRDELVPKIKELRPKIGDRAVLRALHFLDENERIPRQVEALNRGDFKEFLGLVRESGDSSSKLLQNIYSSKHVEEQGVTLALALTENYISTISDGACRVHGGGFAGTIQVFLPNEAVDHYTKFMESVFGEGKIVALNTRPRGSLYLNPFLEQFAGFL